jgi:DNA-directed RNA polymerase
MNEDQLQILYNWKIEKKRVLTQDRVRKGKMIMLAQAMNLARKVDDIYFVYNCDFRGRIYCATTALSPQGPDPIKSLLKFTKGKPMGESGLFWLAVNIANKYGHDKVDYEDRVAWVEDNKRAIEAVANDPLGEGYSFAVEADKPFQFIAACMEWRDADYGNNPEAVGHLPIGLDGSCNGLQHYSALLRDSIGGRQTNLTPSDVPADIYQAVADVTVRKLTALGNLGPSRASKWLHVGVNRKTAKRPVMTLPYGSTQQSARKYINEYVHDNIIKFGCDEMEAWNYAMYLTPHLWASIGEVVVAASEGMKWLMSASKKVAASGNLVKWITPIGFPVMQTYRSYDYITVETQISGRLQLKVHGAEAGVNPYKQSNGIAPNYVHSMDSTHMVMTINAMPEVDLAMIHDDFGTHAADTEKLFRTIRETFVTLYDDKDHLKDWAEQQGDYEFKDRPEMGDLDIKQVLNSEFFFG